MIVDTDKLVESKLLTLAARGLMILGVSVGLPVAGFMMSRILAAADTIAAKVDKTAVQVELLKQRYDLGADATKADLSGIRAILTDHEGRLRVIERRVSN
jgi:hypothetical protein